MAVERHKEFFHHPTHNNNLIQTNPHKNQSD